MKIDVMIFTSTARQSIQEENSRCHRDGGLMGNTLRAFFFCFFNKEFTQK